MKIYTKTGDKGMTSLAGGARVPKTHVRLEAYGTLDELNAQLGVLCTYLVDGKKWVMSNGYRRNFSLSALCSQRKIPLL